MEHAPKSPLPNNGPPRVLRWERIPCYHRRGCICCWDVCVNGFVSGDWGSFWGEGVHAVRYLSEKGEGRGQVLGYFCCPLLTFCTFPTLFFTHPHRKQKIKEILTKMRQTDVFPAALLMGCLTPDPQKRRSAGECVKFIRKWRHIVEAQKMCASFAQDYEFGF